MNAATPGVSVASDHGCRATVPLEHNQEGRRQRCLQRRVGRADASRGAGDHIPMMKKPTTSVGPEIPIPVELAGAMSHLRGASFSIDRLLVDVDPDAPTSKALERAAEAIHLALEALAECAQGSR